jgi:CMP-N-acetylneuraminic acid synthetase/spore coat polysaccharide biosynthesis predicted glycosyltransferase SpsG
MGASASRPLLSIVPARGGSRGVPRKNMRMVGGKPLIARTLEVVRDAGVSDRLLVSSDDEVILRWARMSGFEALERPPELADDAATISDVAAHVADALDWDGDVAVFQPTSPFRTTESVIRAVEQFRDSDLDSLSSCVRENHLYWFDRHGDLTRAEPLFEERLNRQFADARVLRETGSIQLVRAKSLRETRQIVSDRHGLLELDPDESLDIDTYEDLAVARHRLEQGTVVFRLRANATVGSGHLYHSLQLADELHDQRLRFLLKDCDEFVERALAERDDVYRTESDLEADLMALAGAGPNVVVNDVLDTTERDVLIERACGFSVVNIEDLGPGARFADWVVNALYPVEAGGLAHVAWGPAYATLRDEFHQLPPKDVKQEANRVLITFGGTDPAGLAERCARLLSGSTDAEITVLLGPGAATDHDWPEGVRVERQVRSVAAEMAEADLVLTSAGRTVYEAAATGTPVIVIAQNAREATHAHLGYSTGVVFMGVGPLVDDAEILAMVQKLLGNEHLRQELSDRLRGSIDSAGAARIAHRIRGLMSGIEP